MNLQIDIQQNTPIKDSYGQMVESWGNVTGLTGLFASMITTGGREFYAAQKMNAETAAVFKLRYIEGITNLMRVKYGTRYFDILNANNVNEKFEYLLISAKEVI
jgi:SPP1 family predicted phage head-tail adaptor